MEKMLAESNSHSDHESWYKLERMIGNGSFGIVHEATVIKTNQRVAIKKVLQDPRYKNRELSIMRELHHPNIVNLTDYFYTEHIKDQETHKYLNLVMEFVPETVYRVMRSYFKKYHHIPINLVKIYSFQICRAFGYLHSRGVCHRDLKPHNLLVDLETNVLKLCDFGSAKMLKSGEWSVAYICSRFYRAPELMLGANEYTTAIDSWSIGCVIGELLLGRPLFAGDTSIDQLVKIIQILGTPSLDQMQAMNPNYNNVTFPNLRPVDWKKVFPKYTPDDAISFVSQFLRYDPKERVHPLEALAHPFFDDLLSSNSETFGFAIPELLNFTEEELDSMSPSCKDKLQIKAQS
ncbi:protein kinase domain containing protein [Theileria equi strain WA]|uniref:Protein kinase domain containing protein n=1 Tax=Theileria equi strain WA TaxID=1537102 RepID=L1L912_THEEQ|nr:protein kinase domain containing protein [Theileria equi strain WA]EKX71996.1 protein kinase domain containing protein [Theileria equi strain WA]|eukprot:XP_004831448.1 protein kinase domain containing protein [Theileria equi strain WA]